MIKKLGKTQALQLYQEKISKDFIEPFPTYEEYKQAIKNQIYQTYLYMEEGIEKAYAVIQEQENMLFIPWYAVYEEQRGKGIGTKALQEIKEYFQKEILLEVENGDKENNPKQLETISKRIRFYQKLGFKTIQEISYTLNGEPYNLMIFGKEKTKEEIKKEIEECYRKVLEDFNQLQIKI